MLSESLSFVGLNYSVLLEIGLCAYDDHWKLQWRTLKVAEADEIEIRRRSKHTIHFRLSKLVKPYLRHRER